MNQLQRSVRDASKRGGLVWATVTDVVGDYASVRVSGIGSRYTGLLVIGGPVEIGQDVRVKLTAGLPYIVAPMILPEVKRERKAVRTRSRATVNALSDWGQVWTWQKIYPVP